MDTRRIGAKFQPRYRSVRQARNTHRPSQHDLSLSTRPTDSEVAHILHSLVARHEMENGPRDSSTNCRHDLIAHRWFQGNDHKVLLWPRCVSLERSGWLLRCTAHV